MPGRRSMALAFVGVLASAAAVYAADDAFRATTFAQRSFATVTGDAQPATLRAPEATTLVPTSSPAPGSNPTPALAPPSPAPALNPNPVIGPMPSPVPTPNPYYDGISYMPERNPDGRAGLCEYDHLAPKRVWLTVAYFLGLTEDLGNVKREEANGVRLGAGYWFDNQRSMGLDFSFLAINDTHHSYTPAGAMINSPVILDSGDVNFRGNLATFSRYRFDGLVGYRFLRLGERYNSVGGPPPVTSNSNNIVHAAQVGFVSDYHFGPYFSELAIKAGFGRNYQEVTLNGVRTNTAEFAVVPEVTFRVGSYLGSGTRAFIGYNMIYLNNAARPNGLGPNEFSINAIQLGLEFLY